MGKQASFYMEREIFLELAQTALDLGCHILRQSGDKIVSGTDLSIITGNCSQYYFYLPEAGELDETLPLGCYNANGNVVIEASYSPRCKDNVMRRGKLYVVSGVSGKDGEFISRPDCLAKVYRKLVSRMKQLTNFVEIPAEKRSNRLNYYADPADRYHKLYITDKLYKKLNTSTVTLG